jgi:DNA-binding transcriptional LysR family regulator
MESTSLIHLMNIDDLDLNLLRLFASIYQTRSVSRAAERLKISQPAASNGLARLRFLLGDALFARAHGGVRPTPVAEQLAGPVIEALGILSSAIGESEQFDPLTSSRIFRLHMSDIGEARFLPMLMSALHQKAPGVRLECRALPHEGIAHLLDTAQLDFAIGFLPAVRGTGRTALLNDRYCVVLRREHPFVLHEKKGALPLASLKRLEFAAVRTHAQTVRILERLELAERVRLTATHFLALPAIVQTTDLAVIIPARIAEQFFDSERHVVLDARLPDREFTVSLHFSERRETDPAQRWMRGLIEKLFRAGGVGP